MRLRTAALAVLIGEAASRVHEQGGDNRGARVRQYLANVGIGVPAAWCAAAIQWAADHGAWYLGVDDPLDWVEQEALVESYAMEGERRGWVVLPWEARAGDLVLFMFPEPGADEEPKRWNHCGLLEDAQLQYVMQNERRVYHSFRTVEGNTSPGVGLTPTERDREGDGVYRKVRKFVPGRTLFLRWDEATEG